MLVGRAFGVDDECDADAAGAAIRPAARTTPTGMTMWRSSMRDLQV
jgi:hypothetical protein